MPGHVYGQQGGGREDGDADPNKLSEYYQMQVIAGGSRTSSDSFASYRTPLHADFLLAHSTVAGYYR